MIQFGLHILGYDICFFLSHLLLHTTWLYPYHKIHHEKMVPTWWDTYHGHWLEGPFQSLGFLAPFCISWTWTDAYLALVFVNVRGMLRHDARGAWIVGLHHLRHHELFSWNYGEPWLDWLWGTLRT